MPVLPTEEFEVVLEERNYISYFLFMNRQGHWFIKRTSVSLGQHLEHYYRPETLEISANEGWNDRATYDYESFDQTF